MRAGHRKMAGSKRHAPKEAFGACASRHARPGEPGDAVSALAGLHARVLLVDDIDAAMTAHDAAVLVAGLGRFQAVADLHGATLQAVDGRQAVTGTPPRCQ